MVLTEKIREMIELLARNTHENWAQQRLDEGWRYGPKRDDTRKEHPCLVAYDELPENEKEYDRQSVLETIKSILAFGYEIIEPGHQKMSGKSPFKSSESEAIAIMKSLDERSTIDLNVLNGLWLARNPELWASNTELYRHLGERFLNLGEPLMAYDVLSEGLKFSQEDVRLKQLLALSLARSGATEQAKTVLLQLYKDGSCDEETLGLLARTYKDLWLHTTEPALRGDFLRKAFEYYVKAYRLTCGYWTGINVATTALLLGERDKAISIASEVRKCCINELNQKTESDTDRYWLLATLGEASLIMEQWSEAEDWYAQTAEQGQGRYGDLNSTHRNAQLITKFLGADCGWIEKYFRIPRVVVFSGHMIDRPKRAVPRFPPQFERTVYKAILKRLKELNVGFGYASAACGSDILFLEAVLEAGGEIHIMLPYDKEQFAHDSVDIIPGSDWRARYEQLLDRAAQVLTASNNKMDEGSVYYDYANLLLLGLAKKCAEQLETDLVPMAVWDGNQGDGFGGTATVIEHWREHGHTVEVIDPVKIFTSENPGLKKVPGTFSTRMQAEKTGISVDFSQKIMAILFADVVKFSKLDEKEVSCFVKYFLGAISELITDSPYAPEIKNTWGDALYFVFSNVRHAGLFAMDLCDLVDSKNWTEKGLPESFNLRIALHSGPVLSCVDPVIGAPTFTGTHVSLTARIEPVTPPGQVYASQAFAALSSAENITEFTCEYVGQTTMAKEYGTFPTYRIRRKIDK